MSRQSLSFLPVVLTPLLLVGCAAGPQLPMYAEPSLPADQLVTVEGKGGTYITIVDNAECKRPMLNIAGSGGNKVRMSPGKHRLTVINRPSEGAQFSFNPYPVAYRSDITRALEFNFVAGHNYEIELDNKWNPKNNQFRLTDTTSGVSLMQ